MEGQELLQSWRMAQSARKGSQGLARGTDGLRRSAAAEWKVSAAFTQYSYMSHKASIVHRQTLFSAGALNPVRHISGDLVHM